MKNNMLKNWHRLLVFFGWALTAVPLSAQISPRETGGSSINTIQSVVPFLTIAPDSRSGGMGDVGAATSPDVYSMHWNPAKYAFIDGSAGLAISYSLGSESWCPISAWPTSAVIPGLTACR